MIYLSNMDAEEIEFRKKYPSLIDEKDLRQLKQNEFSLEGYFYKKDDHGTWRRHTVNIPKSEEDVFYYKIWVKKELSEGNLYIRINKPWQDFTNVLFRK